MLSSEEKPCSTATLKTELLSLYGPRDEDAFKKALALRLGSGTPSALGKKLIHVICPGVTPMEGCHCARMIYGFWEAQMSSAIKTKIAGKSFNKDTYKDLFKEADEAWRANGGATQVPAVVAAVSAPSPSDVSTPPQVAAVRGAGRGNFRGGRGNRGNRGGNNTGRGANNQNQSQNNSNSSSNTSSNKNNKQGGQKSHQKGPRHSPDVPDDACARHWKEGRGATYCSDPLVCSWVNVITPRN